MLCDPFDVLAQIALTIPSDTWMLVGGLMVHCHAQRAGVRHVRPTQDVDLVVEVRAASYAHVAGGLLDVGFRLHEPLNASAPVHRFERDDGAVVDLMAPDRQTIPQRYGRRLVVEVPGSQSALKRVIPYNLPNGSQISIPDLPSALSLKSRAYFLPGANRQRHLQDAITLLVCLDGVDYSMSKSMKSNLNKIVRVIALEPDAWQMCPPTDWSKAIRAARGIDPQWVPPEFIQPARPTGGGR